jgi:hypothetical protein
MSFGDYNRYWIPNFDINKKVITQEIQYYLGPDATVRPYTREVRKEAILSMIISLADPYLSRARMDSLLQLPESA